MRYLFEIRMALAGYVIHLGIASERDVQPASPVRKARATTTRGVGSVTPLPPAVPPRPRSRQIARALAPEGLSESDREATPPAGNGAK